MVLAEDLRQAVLQAALQGKLTEQLETDSDVDEMLENIQKEKLVAGKVIKKEKKYQKFRMKIFRLKFLIIGDGKKSVNWLK